MTDFLLSVALGTVHRVPGRRFIRWAMDPNGSFWIVAVPASTADDPTLSTSVGSNQELLFAVFLLLLLAR